MRGSTAGSTLLAVSTSESGNGPATPIGISALTLLHKTGPRECSTFIDAAVAKPQQHKLLAHMMTGAYAPVGAAGVGASIGTAATLPQVMTHYGASPRQAHVLSGAEATSGAATAAMFNTASLPLGSLWQSAPQASVKYGTLEPAGFSLSNTSAAPFWAVNTSAKRFGAETSALAWAKKLVSDVFIHDSAIPPSSSSNQIIAEDPRSDINAWSANWRSSITAVEADEGVTGALEEDPTALNNTVDPGLLSGPSSSTSNGSAASTNPIVLENMLQGSPESEWGIDGGGSDNIEGFATDISVDHGQTISFKINTDSTHYSIDIYRLGYYGGDGARKVDTFDVSLPTAQDQPIPLFDPATKLVDAGNWSVSATWDVPADAVSGVYFAKLTRLDGVGGENIIPFIVRDDENPSDITFQTSDTTWQAYNAWGGYDLYASIDGERASAVSYNRPIVTRGGGLYGGPQDFVFSVEYPTIRWLEQNGYDVNYISGVDTARDGAQLLNSQIFLSVGHDEYWSGDQFANVMAARDAGVNLAFLSGNEVYWKTRWETSIDGSGTPYRTLVTYKEIRSNANTDPDDTTSTWRDPFYGPGQPENSLTGTMFTVDSYRLDTITIPYALSNFRFWTNTAVDDLQPGQVYSLTPNLLGYEWDFDIDNGFRPAGLIDLSSTTIQVEQKLLDYGTITGEGTATHALTLYRAASGALVFGAGSVYWAWGLDEHHDLEETPVDPNVQQAMVNLFADMGVQPDTLMASLVLASQSTDDTAPTSTIATPGASATLPAFSPITITGTAVDTGGGIVAAVEVSTDNGATWHRANGFENWTYSWTPVAGGTYTIKSRAVDDSVNIETVGPGVTVTVDQPLTRTLFTDSQIPSVQVDPDTHGVNLGVKFAPTQPGTIIGVKFYKGLLDTGDHVGSLWSSDGTLLASVTFTNELVGGWQTAVFSNPVSVTGGTSYVVSYHSNGHYADTTGFFDDPYGNGPLSVAGNASGTGNSYYGYGNASAFPITSAGGTNFWVDVLYVPDGLGANHAPSTTDDIAFTQQDTILNIVGSQLLANDSDADGDVLSISGAGGEVNGTVSYDPQTNTVTFIPTPGFQGPASFNYYATDGQEATTGTVNVAVVEPFAAEGLFTSSQTPSILSDPDPAQVNLGVKFVASEAGSIAGLKYYRGANDQGTHTGSLWSSTGQLLATATFAAETASGWQTVYFSSPVTITPDTTYIASYHSNGHYTATGDFFISDYTNDDRSLSAPGPGAGVYTYGAGGLFPTTTSNANYWVDVLFASSGAPIAVNDSGFVTAQETQLQIPAASLLANDTDPNNDPLSIVDVGPGVGGMPTYAAGTVTFTPDPGFIGAATFTYDVTDGTNDPASASVDLTVLPPPTVAQLFAYADTPAILGDPDPNSINLGVQFQATEAGEITGLKYYKGADDTGTHVGSLWTSDGTLLASATFINESASGWQYVTFDNPVSISADTTYVASYHSNGHYTATGNFFISEYTNGDGSLSTPAAAGVYTYGASDLLPTSTSNANYWVDVLFASSGAPIAVNDGGFTTSQETPLQIPAATLLANDTDPNGDQLSIESVVPGVGGALTYGADTVTFTPDPGFIGAATFTYRVTDGTNDSASASVNLTVLPPSTVAQLFDYADTPAILGDPDSNGINLGVKFQATEAGEITGLKYYKGADDIGTHVGSLWTSDGTLLTSATFTNESASGWQYVTFDNPASISADTTYVASYHSNGHYTATGNFFISEYTNGDGSLSTPVAAGVYTYGAGDQFPTGTSNANYYVDVLFAPSGAAPSPLPPVANNDSGFVATENTEWSIPAAALLANDTDASGFSLSILDVSDLSGGTVTYNPSTELVTFTPTTDYAGTASFNYSVSDGNGSSASATVSLLVNDPSTLSLFNPATTPSIVTVNDPSSVELGVKFQASTDGIITGLRFYKGPDNDGTHTADLWNATTGASLATATFTNETPDGWQQVNFAAPVPITAGTTYVASYHTSGNYSADPNLFATAITNTITNANESLTLTAPSSAASGGNGVYAYGSDSLMPTNSFNATSYGVDVIFKGQLAA